MSLLTVSSRSWSLLMVLVLAGGLGPHLWLPLILAPCALWLLLTGLTGLWSLLGLFSVCPPASLGFQVTLFLSLTHTHTHTHTSRTYTPSVSPPILVDIPPQPCNRYPCVYSVAI
ncbi:hypothetical protein OF83DRAFT_1157344 [Amylostereum chailletii]|nr:hypothetical protein OF83DRAFT_1157344 [Amylostereum chailletii]